MKKVLSILLCALALVWAVSCEKKPADNGNDPVEVDDPETPDEPEKPEPPGPSPKDVTLMNAFTEDFSSREGEYVTFARRTDRDDFRYYSAFPSLSERNTTILMLRLDPSDSSGEGTAVTTKDYVSYGSFSARIKLPDTSVQAKLGAVAELSLFDEDPVWGDDEYTLGFRLADKQNLYLKGRHEGGEAELESFVDENVKASSLSSFDSSSKFYIYGMDWTPDKISWWIKASATAEPAIVYERTENVPSQPLRLQFRLYHSKTSPTKDNSATTQVPYYPFELEIDWIQYTPSEQ